MISFVQGQSNTVHGAGSLNASFPSANTAGNLILVCVGAYGGGTSPTVSDSQGNTYTQIQTDSGGSGSGSVVSVWYAQNVKAGANTVTVAQSSSADIDLVIAEYSGLSASAALTASSIALATGSSVSASAVTPGYPNDALILFAYDQSNSGDTFTFSSSPSQTLVQRESTSNTGGGESSSLVDFIGTLDNATTSTVSIGPHSNALYLVAILLTDAVAPNVAGGPELMIAGAWSVTSTSQTREAGFGATPLSYSATGLPSGVTLESDGNLSGTVSTAGSYTFTVTATDANGKTASVTVTASISAVPVDTSVCAAILPGFVV